MKLKLLAAVAALCVAGTAQAYSPPVAIPLLAVVPGGTSETVFDIGDANYTGEYYVSADFVGLMPDAVPRVFGSSPLSGSLFADGRFYDMTLTSGRLTLADTRVLDLASMSFTVKADSLAFGGAIAGAVAFREVPVQPSAVPEPEIYAMFLAGLGALLSMASRRRSIACRA